jgi:DNA-binding transcriptional MerR regulator
MESESRIPEKLFFRIGEVCDLIKVQPHVLRYWETEFPMLAPQKNRAGQRVYRRKDVEMVFRIRDLLYEEKFTIAGAKKRLLDEIRGGSGRARVADESPPEETDDHEPEPNVTSVSGTDAPSSPQVQRALRKLKSDLEDLLTRLKSDASIKR